MATTDQLAERANVLLTGNYFNGLSIEDCLLRSLQQSERLFSNRLRERPDHDGQTLSTPYTARRRCVVITAIETVQPRDLFPGLLLVRIHTEDGLIGHGETYCCAEAVQAMIHDWMARRLLGEDALAIESHWRFLYERAANFGVRGTELRAISRAGRSAVGHSWPGV